MPDLALTPPWPDPGVDGTSQPTVLITMPDENRRRRLTEQLVDGGLRVLGCSSWTEALDVLDEESVDLGLVDSCVSDYYTEPPTGPRAVGRPTPSELPLLFLVDNPVEFDWDAYAQLDRAEISSAPVPSLELSLRVCALAKRVRRQGEERRAEDQLRTAVRLASADIRSTNNPQEITERLVDRLVEVFGVDLVAFTTFSDDRVPEVALQWARIPGRVQAVDTTGHRPAQRALAERLWQAGTVLALSDHRQHTPPVGVEELFAWAQELGARGTISVPIGDGHDVLGLIWLAMFRPKSWGKDEISLLQHLAGNVAHQLMQAQVITDQQEVVRRLGRLDRAKSEFLTTVTHELRTPLTSLSAYLDLVREGSAGPIPPRAADMLNIVDRSARRLSGLVDDVLTVSRIVASDPDMAWSPVDVAALAGSVVSKLRSTASAAGVELSARLPDRLMVDGDPVHLKQVLVQLTDNAVKFTGPGGRVEVEVCELDIAGAPTVQICVADTGVGIEREDVPELFNRFVRGSNAHAAAASGSGLGLAIVSGLVEAHHGQVTVESPPGGGTRAVVRLPKTRVEFTDRFLTLPTQQNPRASP